MTGAVEKAVERAVAERKIIRTWPMRRTLHFVAAADVRWLLELLTPRVLRSYSQRGPLLGLDDGIFARSRKVLTRALAGCKPLRRTAIHERLGAAGVSFAAGP